MVRGRGKTSIMAVLYKLVARVFLQVGRARLRAFPIFFQIRGGEQERGRPPPPQWPCLERRRSGRCGDRADDLYTGLTRDVATTQYTQRLGAAVGTGAASPRTQPPRSRSIIHGLARYRWILQRPEHNMGAGKNTKGVMGRNRNNNSQQCTYLI